MQTSELNDTAHKILDAAKVMITTEGFNAFSYKDLQQKVGIKTSSIHYYFPTKQDLAAALIERNNERLLSNLAEIDAEAQNGLDKIIMFGKGFLGIASQGKCCVYGMLSSDLMSMSAEGAEALKDFFYKAERWLANAIRQGMEEGDIRDSLSPKEAAAYFLATIEGGVLIARVHRKGEKYMQSILDQALLFFKK